MTDVVDFIQKIAENTPVYLLINLKIHEGRTPEQELNLLLQKGFTRIWKDDKVLDIEDFLNEKNEKTSLEIRLDEQIHVLIDRFKTNPTDDELRKRIGDSVQTCFNESGGACIVFENQNYTLFNNKFEMDGLEFPEPTQNLFNYNNPYGACPRCEGYGKTLGIDIDKVVPDKGKSVYEGAIACWKGETMGEYLQHFLKIAHKFDFPVHLPYRELSEKQKAVLWSGNGYFAGIKGFFDEIEAQTYKIQYRVLLARYRGKTNCPECNGSRLRKEASYIKVGDTPITDLMLKPISQLNTHFKNIKLNENDEKIAKRLLQEIATRLEFMERVGLGYLHLDRQANSLSGGETQRIHLTRSLGSNLTSSMYILDEPSIGLHPRDTNRLVDVLKNLRDLGNTVIVVEHEEDMIKNADYLIDIGPAAGVHGGHVVFQGEFKEIYERANDSLTAQYLTGRMGIAIPKFRRKWFQKINIADVRQHNLKGFDVEIPLSVLTVVTGVSGSGKTTLIKQILYPALQKAIGENTAEQSGDFGELTGDFKKVTQVEMVNQNPIGKSSRSNPVTYVKAYDEIRDLFANQQLSKIKGFKPKHFSFNVEGGRCETCKGEGEQMVEMQFLADVRLECEDCRGKRFQQEVLDVQYKNKNIFEVLDLSIEEALEFFKEEKSIIQKIKPLFDVGLGYVRLGQSSNTLSGGEAQRVKLASFLVREKSSEHIMFIFDEPTTGLHFHDINKLLAALNALVDKGHTVIVIEHNLEIVKCADWVLDLGPEGGHEGGHLVFAGTPEDLLHCEKSYTAKYLKMKM